jgi:serine/threonine protein kinase
MIISSRTPEGLPNRCPVCGTNVRIEPSNPAGDAPCPQCGHLLWFVNRRLWNLPEGCHFTRTKLLSSECGETWAGVGPGGVPVAIKLLLLPLDAGQVQVLKKIERLHHPHLLPIWVSWKFQDRLVIVTVLGEGSLRDRLRADQQAGLPAVPVDELLRHFGTAAEALDYLHGVGIIHGDIKPDNLLLVKGQVKVAELATRGLALQAHFRAKTCGTPAYMAPEVWQGKTSPHSDQYSLAMAYIELRLGHPPFPAKDMMQMILCHLKKQPDIAALSKAEQRVLLKAVAKDAQQRYPSCRKFLQALERAVKAKAGSSTAERHAQPKAKLHSRLLRWMGSLASSW